MKKPTLQEVKSAIDQLSLKQRAELVAWLDGNQPRNGKNPAQPAARRNAKNGQTLTSGRQNGYNHPKMSTNLQRESTARVGRKIAEKRQELHMSQEVLASEAGISRIALAFIETGKRNPRQVTLRSIAAVLRTTAAKLLAGV